MASIRSGYFDFIAHIDLIKNISRNFNNKPNMRDIVVNRESCSPFVTIKIEVAE